MDIRLSAGSKLFEVRLPKTEELSIEDQRKLADMKKSAEGFEAIFLKQMLQKVMPKSLAAGPGADIYQDMLLQGVSQDLAKTGALGITQLMFENLSSAFLRQRAEKVALDGSPLTKGSH